LGTQQTSHCHPKEEQQLRSTPANLTRAATPGYELTLQHSTAYIEELAWKVMSAQYTSHSGQGCHAWLRASPARRLITRKKHNKKKG